MDNSHETPESTLPAPSTNEEELLQREPLETPAPPKPKKRARWASIVLERILEGVRDSNAVHETGATGEPTSQVSIDEDILTGQDAVDAQKEWGLGALAYREGQLEKFNGKEDTADIADVYFRQELAAIQLEVEAGTAWHLNDGDPLRFQEEPVNADPEVLRAELHAAMTEAADYRDAVECAQDRLSAIDETMAELRKDFETMMAALEKAKLKPRFELREAMAPMKIAEQRVVRLRQELKNIGVEP